LKLTVAK